MKSHLGALQYGIIFLTIITALIHLALGIVSIPDFFGILFILNGIGYLVLLAGLYFIPRLAERRGLIRWLLLAFTAVTIVLFFAFNSPGNWGLGGLIDKSVELLLIILLLFDRGNA